MFSNSKRCAFQVLALGSHSLICEDAALRCLQSASIAVITDTIGCATTILLIGCTRACVFRDNQAFVAGTRVMEGSKPTRPAYHEHLKGFVSKTDQGGWTEGVANVANFRSQYTNVMVKGSELLTSLNRLVPRSFMEQLYSSDCILASEQKPITLNPDVPIYDACMPFCSHK